MKLSTWQEPERPATPQTIAEIVAELPGGPGRFIVLTPDGDSDASFRFMQATWRDGGFFVEVREGPQIFRCPRRDLTKEEVSEAFCQYLHAEGDFRPPWPVELATFSVRPTMVARRRASGRIYTALAASAPLAALLTAMSHFNLYFAGLTLALVVSVVLLRRALFQDTVLVVGTDGFALRWPGHERFVGYGEVREISRDDSGVIVTLASGERLVVPLADTVAERGMIQLERISGLEEMLRDALRRYGRHRGADGLSCLRRGGRTTNGWVEALRAVGVGANVDNRIAPVFAEQLLPIVADVRASTVDRAAAAVAVGATGAESRKRLRELATATGDVRLRIVIERAADDTDVHAIEEAIAALEADGEHERRATARDGEPGQGTHDRRQR